MSILAKLALRPEKLVAAGVEVFVRPMNVGELIAFSAARKASPERTAELLFAYSICEEDGSRPFSPERLSEVDAVGGAIANAVVAWAIEANGMSADSGKGHSSDPTRG